MTALTRRSLLALAAAASALVWMPAARAQDPSVATTFIDEFGKKLIDVVNADQPDNAKAAKLAPLIDQAVDVDTIARFCLGRYVNDATPQQISEFTKLFHQVLVENITAKIGQYRGVTFRMTDTSVRGTEAFVGTIVQRPNNAPNNVRWVVSTASGAPKIVDVVAEGTSLRLTQRSDYASYLSHNGNSVEALISALKRQVSAS